MDRFIANLPAGVLATGVLAVCLLLFLRMNPLPTDCDGQTAIFREAQTGFLFESVKKELKFKPRFDELAERCRFQAGPGGCAELFDRLRKLTVDLGALGVRCEGEAGQTAELGRALWGSLELMTKMAWGEGGPRTYVQRAGWFGSREIELFCRLKAKATSFYGPEAFQAFREKSLADLPLPKGVQLSRAQIRERSLYGISCEALR